MPVGWSNYLVLPKYKLCFEVSRHDGNSTEEYEDHVKDLERLEVLLEEPLEIGEITVDDIVKSRKATLQQLAQLIALAHATVRLPTPVASTGLFSQLRHYDPKTYLLSDIDDVCENLRTQGYTFIDYA